MKAFHKRILAWTVAVPLTYSMVVQTHSIYHMHFGKTRNFKESTWFLNLSETEKENVTQRRKPMVDNLKGLYEMKDTKLNSYFSDNVKYDDVFLRCYNKNELETCFGLMPKSIKSQVTNKFDISHYENFILVESERSVLLRQYEISEEVKSCLNLTLSKENDKEVVTHIFDKYNGFEILGPEINRYTGHLARFFRRLRTLYSINLLTKTKSASVYDDIENSIRGIFKEEPPHSDEMLLEQPVANFNTRGNNE